VRNRLIEVFSVALLLAVTSACGSGDLDFTCYPGLINPTTGAFNNNFQSIGENDQKDETEAETECIGTFEAALGNAIPAGYMAQCSCSTSSGSPTAPSGRVR
jgi:hypothetical protein